MFPLSKFLDSAERLFKALSFFSAAIPLVVVFESMWTKLFFVLHPWKHQGLNVSGIFTTQRPLLSFSSLCQTEVKTSASNLIKNMADHTNGQDFCNVSSRKSDDANPGSDNKVCEFSFDGPKAEFRCSLPFALPTAFGELARRFSGSCVYASLGCAMPMSRVFLWTEHTGERCTPINGVSLSLLNGKRN